MKKVRVLELINECVGYICELKEHDTPEEKEYFWKEVIGMTDEEIEHFGLTENERA